MDLHDFIATLTKEDLDTINQIFKELNPKIPTYTFSQITDNQLSSIVNIKKKIPYDVFDFWFNNNITLSTHTIHFLETLISEHKYFFKDYNEEDLKINFIGPILNKINYKSLSHEIRAYYDAKLYYETKDFILTGECDFLVSKGLFKVEKPYFFIQEFKRAEKYKNPRPQLLAELIAATESNNFKQIKGAYIVGAIWNFVILEKMKTNEYQYYISEDFSSDKIKDLMTIYRNLLFVKNEIIQWVTP